MNNALSLHVAILGSYLVLCLPFLKDWMQSLRGGALHLVENAVFSKS